MLGVEQAIVQQIVAAVEPKYLRALHQPGTNRLQQRIPTILDHLFDTYGDVTPQDLRELIPLVKNLAYPPSEPVDTIFAEIDELAAIAEIAQSPITASQKINMAYIMFQKAHVYKYALARWDERDLAEKTWGTFKTHFRLAYKALQRTCALTVKDTMERQEIMNMVTDGVHHILNTFRPPSPPTTPVDLPTLADTPSIIDTDESLATANSTVSNMTLQTLQKQMEIMQAMMAQMNQMASRPQQSGNMRKNNKSTQLSNGNLSKYCWTHGLCHHPGSECCLKADGHKDEATLANRLGGSTNNITE